MLDIPLDRSDTKYYLYYQTQHQKSTVQGRVARVPPKRIALFNQIPLLKAWQKSIGAPRPLDLGAQLQQLAASQRALHHPAQRPHVAGRSSPRCAITSPCHRSYEDDQIAVYSTRPAGQPITLMGWIWVWSTVGPASKARTSQSGCGFVGPPLNPSGAISNYRLALVDENNTAVITQTDRLMPATSSVAPGTIVIGDYQLTPVTPVPIGRYRFN